MVIKGGARAEADKLAAHLLRVDTNERVDVRELLGVCAPDLTAALLEMEAIASAARSRRPFYHASINTAPGELLTEAQKARTIDRLEQELGLTGQPRIVVEHVKDGREHLHVAWSRIDGETLCAIPDSHNYRRHEIVARELEREFEHARVQGAHHEREGVERPARCPSHAETRQAERSGISPEDAKAQLRELWQSADNGHAFAAALDNAGWTLAQGDKRGFVALDPAGEVRAVNKDITGLSAAKVRERLADLDPSQLPNVDEARQQLRGRQQQSEPAPALDPALDREVDDAALDAELAQTRREIAEGEALLAGLDAIAEAVREQFREQRELLNAAGLEAARDEALARETQQRGGDAASSRLKSPEEMRRDWADLMRGGVLDERTEAQQDKARDLAAPDIPPQPDRVMAQDPDHLAERTAWAERLRGFASEPAQEARREAEPVRTRERTPEPDAAPHAPEKKRGRVFQKLRDFVRGWFKSAPQAEPTRDHAADQRHEAPHVCQADRVRPLPVQQPVQERASPPEAARTQQPPQQEQARPAERLVKQDFADELLAEARARLAKQTPEQQAERERQAEQSRGRGDGSRERTRHRHSLLWELLHPSHDPRSRDHQRRPGP